MHILSSNVALFVYFFSAASSRVEDEVNGSSSLTEELNMEPVPLTENGQLPAGFVLEDLESHYIYICEMMSELT